MSCDVCIGGGDYDGMAEFYRETRPKARKQHRCVECAIPILPGEVHVYTSGKFEGDLFHFRTHATCHEILQVFSCGEPYTYGHLWEDMRELAFPRLTTASECFVKLSVASKERVLEEWRKWKFGIEQAARQ